MPFAKDEHVSKESLHLNYKNHLVCLLLVVRSEFLDRIFEISNSNLIQLRQMGLCLVLI